MWLPDDPKEGLAAHAAGKAAPQEVHDAEWALLGAVTLEMPIAPRSSSVGVIQRQFAVDGANNLQVLALAFAGNNNNKNRLLQLTYSPGGALLHKNVVRFGHTDDLNSGDFWKGDGFAACGVGSGIEVYADCHQIPGPGGFNRAGMGGTPDGAPFIIPGVWTPVADGLPVAFSNIVAPTPGHVSFPGDVPAGSAFYEDVEWAAANGLAGGIGGGKLGADKLEPKVHVVAYQGRMLRLLTGGSSAQAAGKKGK